MTIKNLMNNLKAARRRRTRGAITLEFALTMPFLVWVLFGICEYGMALNTINTLTQLARDGARYAAVHATQTNCYQPSTTTGSTKAFMVNESKGTSITLADSNIALGYIDDVSGSTTYQQFVAGTPTTPGKNVAVQITYDMTKRLWTSTAGIVPGLSQIAVPNYKKRAVFVIEKP